MEHSWTVVCWGYMGVPERCGVKIGAGCGWLLWMGLSGSVLVDKEGYTVPVGVVQVVRWWYTRCDGVQFVGVYESNQSSVVKKGILGQLILFYLEKIVFYFYIYLFL